MEFISSLNYCTLVVSSRDATVDFMPKNIRVLDCLGREGLVKRIGVKTRIGVSGS